MISAPKEAKTNPYISKFNENYVKNKNITQAITCAVSLFLEHDAATTEESKAPAEIRLELTNYLEAVKTAPLGRIIQKREFSDTLPEPLIALFRTVALIEQSAFCAPNTLICDCENQIAAGECKPHIVYQQAARIEAAKVANQFEQRHLFSANAKLTELIARLYGSFAELIFESKTVESLKEKVKEVFSETLVISLPKLKKFREDIDSLIEFLEDEDREQEFLHEFYALNTLADKYEKVITFYEWAKKKGYVEPELKGTLSYLQQHILNTAYKKCEQKKHSLMLNPVATLDEVFSHLRAWIDAGAWRSYGDGELSLELQALFEADRAKYQGWEKLGQRLQELRNPMQTAQKLALFQLHSMKTGDPNQDPMELVAEIDAKILLQSLSSPKKRRSDAVAVVRAPLLSLENMLCDETLDNNEEENIEGVQHSSKKTKIHNK